MSTTTRPDGHRFPVAGPARDRSAVPIRDHFPVAGPTERGHVSEPTDTGRRGR